LFTLRNEFGVKICRVYTVPWGGVRQAACVVIGVAFITKGFSVKGSYSPSKLIISIVVNYFTTELTVH